MTCDITFPVWPATAPTTDISHHLPVQDPFGEDR